VNFVKYLDDNSDNMTNRLHFRNNIYVLQRAEVHICSTLLFHSLPCTGSAYSPVNSHSQPLLVGMPHRENANNQIRKWAMAFPKFSLYVD